MKELNKKLRSWLWHRLVYLADRISPDDAFRSMSGLTVQLRKGKGWTLNNSYDGKGIPVWYCGQRTYDEHAYDGYEEERQNYAIAYGPNAARERYIDKETDNG